MNHKGFSKKRLFSFLTLFFFLFFIEISTKVLSGEPIPNVHYANSDYKSEYRILFLGDSVVFGSNLNHAKTLPVTLQKYLRQYIANKQINVINAGVAEYSTFQKYYFLKKYGLDLSPDLVLLGIALKDVFEPQLSDKAWKEIEDNLLSLKKLCEQNNIPLAVVIFPYAGQVLDKVRSLKPQERLVSFLDKNEIKYFDLTKDFLNRPNVVSLFLVKDRNHLSPEGFDFTGKLLAGYLKSTVNPLYGNPYAVSRIKFYETAADFKGGQYFRTTWQTPKGISLKKSRDDYPTSGSYISLPFVSPFPMSEILPTWNVDCPVSTGFAVYFQVSKDSRSWSEWLFLGRDGYTPKSLKKLVHTTGAVVDVDFMQLTKPFQYFKWRIELFTRVPNTSPLLRRFAVCYGNSSGDEEIFKKFSGDKTAPRGWARKLDLPYYSQLTPEKDIPETMRYSICCPTSVRMVLGYYGIQQSEKEVCDLSLDPEYEIWGGWPRAAQTLYHFRLRSYVTQIRSFEDIKSFIARGIPIIISIRAKKGELPSAPYQEEVAHVLVISGLAEDGRVWVEDPYNVDGKMGPRFWTRAEIEKTFIGTGGVAIIAEPPSGN